MINNNKRGRVESDNSNNKKNKIDFSGMKVNVGQAETSKVRSTPTCFAVSLKGSENVLFRRFHYLLNPVPAMKPAVMGAPSIVFHPKGIQKMIIDFAVKNGTKKDFYNLSLVCRCWSYLAFLVKNSAFFPKIEKFYVKNLEYLSFFHGLLNRVEFSDACIELQVDDFDSDVYCKIQNKIDLLDSKKIHKIPLHSLCRYFQVDSSRCVDLQEEEDLEKLFNQEILIDGEEMTLGYHFDESGRILNIPLKKKKNLSKEGIYDEIVSYNNVWIDMFTADSESEDFFNVDHIRRVGSKGVFVNPVSIDLTQNSYDQLLDLIKKCQEECKNFQIFSFLGSATLSGFGVKSKTAELNQFDPRGLFEFKCEAIKNSWLSFPKNYIICRISIDEIVSSKILLNGISDNIVIDTVDKDSKLIIGENIEFGSLCVRNLLGKMIINKNVKEISVSKLGEHFSFDFKEGCSIDCLIIYLPKFDDKKNTLKLSNISIDPSKDDFEWVEESSSNLVNDQKDDVRWTIQPLSSVNAFARNSYKSLDKYKDSIKEIVFKETPNN